MDAIKKKAAANSKRTKSTTSARSTAGAESKFPSSRMDNRIDKEMAGLSRSGSTGPNTNIKRSLNDEEQFYQLFPSRKKTKDDERISGPLYEKRADSIVLYEAESGEEYDADNNPDGYVDVIVSPFIQNGNEKAELTPDQIDGLRFLWKSFTEKKGAILAHEMGLGKTRTIIAFICTLLEQSNKSSRRSTPSVQKIIILAPKNAILNTWGQEFSKWCPNHISNKNTFVFPHDTTDKAIKSIEDFEKQNSMKILLLSYDSFIKYEQHFGKYKKAVDIVICDEAHILKNNLTKRSVVLKKFKSTLWYGITGTPFQNTLEEFCNLVAFFSPGTLPIKYKEDYCRPIEKHLKKHGQLNDSVTKVFEALKNMFSSVLQYKQNDIPVDKHELLVCIDLKGKEEDVANGHRQHELYKMLSESFINEKQTINFYQEIFLLKKLCIHPENAFNSESFKKIACFEEAKELYTTMEESRENLNIEAGRNDPEVNSALYSLLYSAKLTTLFKMLDNIKQKNPMEKVIAVSNSIELLNHIEKICKTVMHFNFARYDGETSEKARDHALKLFNTDDNCFILLLSCKAGGTALNLTRANHMFLMDPDWNPSNDKQALGRIYRHGQERTVFTYRFLCTGTIEESILLNQLSKEEMERFLKEKTPTSKLSLPFAEKDLLDYHSETMSHLNDKLSTLYGEEMEKFVNSTRKSSNPKNDYELQLFADELSRAATYENEEAIPLEDLSALEDAWASGISFIFHKTKLSKDSIENIEKGIINMLSLPPLNVKVTELTSQDLLTRDKKCYVLRKETPRGLVLIVNNKNYMFNSEGNHVENPKDSDHYREHSEIDVKNVRSVFRQMGYLVIIKEDVKGSEINQVVEEFKTELKEKAADVALIFLMGHGANNDNLIMVDGSLVNVWTDVICKFNFDSFSEMKGKPKGFFLSFCQTDLKGIEQVKPSSPLNDIIISQATSPGKVAYGLDKSGSIYIHNLVEIIMKLSHNHDLVEMLEQLKTEMSELVIDVQIPKFQSYLTKKLYLI